MFALRCCSSPLPAKPFSSSYWSLYKALTFIPCRLKYKLPELIDEDLEEKFIRASGPGGQFVNKRSTCVELRHLPTGIIIKCQEERTQERNRVIARRMLQEKLDVLQNGENSLIMQKRKEFEEKKNQKYLKAKKRLEKLAEFREREGINTQSET